MRSLTSLELLEVWEQGAAQPLVKRALLLLEAACPDLSFEALAQLPIGRRDACLLELRERLFGSELAGLAVCPGCGEPLEMGFQVADVLAVSSEPRSDQQDLNGYLQLSLAGCEVHFRLPNSLDLLALETKKSSPPPPEQLLRRCLLALRCDGEDLPFGQCPATLAEAVAEHIAAADPQAEVWLAMKCPLCSHGWEAFFDVVSFFWAEINGWAQRVLHEVHRLASAYGWSEADILALSPRRRQFYSELIQAC